MLEFAEFQQKAKALPKQFPGITSSELSSLGCMGFFSVLTLDNTAADDAKTISMVAETLSIKNDSALLSYMKTLMPHGQINDLEFNTFKSQVLGGLYLLMWSHYNSTLSAYRNQDIIKHFQSTLAVSSPDDLDSNLHESSLNAFCQYCSFLYANKYNYYYIEHKGDDGIMTGYNNILKRLGESVQSDTNLLRRGMRNEGSWYSYSGIMCTLGIKIS